MERTKRTLQPLLHLQDVPYKYERNRAKDGKHVAFVTRPTKEQPFHHIVINDFVAEKILQRSWVKRVLTLEDYVGALTAHEVFHILYGTFEYTCDLEKNPLFQVIDNILEDARIEHFGTSEFSIYARFIDLLLSSIRHEVDLSKVEAESGEVSKKIDQCMKSFFHLVRFGVVLPESDPDFIRFVFPLVLSAKRCSRSDVIIAGRAVYYYLLELAKNDPKFLKSLQNAEAKVVAITREELEEILKSASIISGGNPLQVEVGDGKAGNMQSQEKGVDGKKKGLQIMESSVLEAVKGELLPLIDPQKNAGKGNSTVDTSNGGNEFVQQTVARYPDEIIELCRSLRHLFEKFRRVKAYDGELAVIRQQEAYTDTLLGNDERDYYLINKRMVPDLDAVVGQDVSGSTDSFKDVFSACSVMIHAAMEQTPGVRSVHVDWSDDAKIMKTFGQKLLESTLHPRTAGGTQLEALLQLVEEGIEFRAKRRLLFVVTDGGFYGDEWYQQMEGLMQTKGVTPILVQVDEEGSVDDVLNAEPIQFLGRLSLPLYHCSLRTLPQLFYVVVARELFR